MLCVAYIMRQSSIKTQKHITGCAEEQGVGMRHNKLVVVLAHCAEL